MRYLAGLAVVIAVSAAARDGVGRAGASIALARCSTSSLHLVLPRTQGTATQAVAFLSVSNRGGSCKLIATSSLTVMHNRARVAAIRGNPVSYTIKQTIAHGTTMLFDAWWANWCASRSGLFRVRGVLGTITATAPYNVLPACLGASAPSRLRGNPGGLIGQSMRPRTPPT
jgi:hypothetical protein